MTGIFFRMRWRPTEAAALASMLTQGANLTTRVIHTWPDLTHGHNDLIPVVLGLLPLVLGIFGIEHLG